MLTCLLRVFMCNVKAHMVKTVYLHFLVYCPCHNVARGKRQTFVILLHECFAIWQFKDTTISAHSLCDEECRMSFTWMIQCRWMELNKLHVCHSSLGTIHHSLAVTCGDNWICRCLINGSTTTRTHHRHLAQICIYFLGVGIKHVCSIAVDIWSATCHPGSQVMLGDNLNGKVVLLYRDVWTIAHCLHQTSLDFGARVILVMKNAKLRVSSLAMKVKLTVLLPVEVDTPLHHFTNLIRRIPHHLLHSLAV